MKRLKLFLALLCLLTLTSCGDIDLGIIGGADGPTVTVVGKKADETDTVELPESTADVAYETPAESVPSLPDKDFTELDGDLQFYRFDDGNAAVVWNESDAWVFDFVLDRVIDVFDNEKALASIDIKGEGSGYFTDYVLSPEFVPNSDIELRMIFNVRSKTHAAHYSTYSFYSLNSPLHNFERGVHREYYYSELVYPGSDEPLTVYDVKDIGKLEAGEDNYIADIAVAIVNTDIRLLEELLYLESGVLADWESVEIGEYSISRTDFSSPYVLWLELYVDIEKSDVERLPAGRYKVNISEGMSFPNVEFISLDEPVGEARVLNEAEEWIYSWVRNYGGQTFVDLSDYHADYAWWVHTILDFYLSLNRDAEKIVYEEFTTFAEQSFGVSQVQRYLSRAEVEEHGGHGISHLLCEVVSDYTASGIHFITVNFYADPMQTVIAKTYEFTVHEADTFVIDGVRVVYDSGFPAEGWST